MTKKEIKSMYTNRSQLDERIKEIEPNDSPTLKSKAKCIYYIHKHRTNLSKPMSGMIHLCLL